MLKVLTWASGSHLLFERELTLVKCHQDYEALVEKGDIIGLSPQTLSFPAFLTWSIIPHITPACTIHTPSVDQADMMGWQP